MNSTRSKTLTAGAIAGLMAAGVAGVALGAPAVRNADPGTLDHGRVMPVRDYSVSAGWGHSSGPHAGRHHNGVDFAADMNEPVYAAEAGKIVHAGNAGGYGKMLEIRTDDGRHLIYGHLNRIAVKKGDQVKAGKRVGAVGSTGHSTGPHLHFEVRKNGKKAVSPNKYLGLGKDGLTKLEIQMKRFDR